MNFILRNFFYGVGLVILWAITQFPESVQFRDFVLLMQTSMFWQTSVIVGVFLAAFDFMLSGWVNGPKSSFIEGRASTTGLHGNMSLAPRSDMQTLFPTHKGKQK